MAKKKLTKSKPQPEARFAPSGGSALVVAAENMDWMQVVLHQRTPCFALMPDGNFCGRAKEWPGHEKGCLHKFVSLADLLRTVAPNSD